MYFQSGCIISSSRVSSKMMTRGEDNIAIKRAIFDARGWERGRKRSTSNARTHFFSQFEMDQITPLLLILVKMNESALMQNLSRLSQARHRRDRAKIEKGVSFALGISAPQPYRCCYGRYHYRCPVLLLLLLAGFVK